MNPQSLLTGEIEVIAVGTESAQSALTRISGCEHCTVSAVTAFEKILGQVLINRGGPVTYVLGKSAVCPKCATPILETTLVETIHTWREPFPQMVLVDEPAIVQAQALMSACEGCEDGAGLSFDYLLDAVTESDPSETEYLMCRRARCPSCFHEVTEKTLIIPK